MTESDGSPSSSGSSSWSLDADSGELRILTGVAGRAARMGHRLTIAMRRWTATVQWDGGEPVSAELSVVVDSLEVLSGEGGVTPLAGPAKGVARSNALKSLEAKKFPQIRFAAADISRTAQGYRLSGSVEIHGTERSQVVDLTVEDRGAVWGLSTHVKVTQSDFGVKPYSLFMGSLKVADDVTIDFAATHPK
jgi:polyisoprenoid-binding protein YceI